MNVLIVGSGGREHALAWKLKQSPLLKKLYCAPGNAGISNVAECVDIAVTDLEKLLQFAKSKKIDLTVVGPEVPLVAGIADLFRAEGLLVFGPDQKAAQLEGSKIFSKQKMVAYHIPTARFEEARDFASAKKIIDGWDAFPVVIKSDGLAAGKGVVIAGSKEEAVQTLEDYFVAKKLGEAGTRVVIEEFLEGEELSILAITDGKRVLPLASSQDHKRAFDNDQGPNTGGMGAYSPCPFISDAEMDKIVEIAVKPMISGLAGEGIRYQGLLYAGIMLTPKGPKVLEYNVRFGDPETEAVLPRLKSDLLPILVDAARGELKTARLEWDPRFSVTVVMASGGYPNAYKKGFPLTGCGAAEKTGALVFHAGTARKGSEVVSAGGRVLTVTGLGDSPGSAQAKVYEGVSKIHFEGAFYRKDIAKKILTKGRKVAV